MTKFKFVADFEVNASKKMLYPYISSPSGLCQWFADDVNINEDKIYNFLWDDEDHKARVATQRMNNFIKFEFLQEDQDDDPNYVEFKLEMNEITQTVFFHVTDYSENDDSDELYDMWSNMVDSLKEIVGG